MPAPLGVVEGITGAPGALSLRADRILFGDGGQSASPAWVTIADGRIVATGAGAGPADAVDLGDALLAPGFVDVQVNGTGSVDFASASAGEIVSALDALAARGTTGVLLTICSAPLDAYDEMLERAAAAQAQRPDLVLGVHLEGPFLGRRARRASARGVARRRSRVCAARDR